MLISETLKQLLRLLADGQFHSGTELSQVLAISRSAIWKQLHALSDLGVELMAVSGKGYKLQQPMQLLDQHRIASYLDRQVFDLIKCIEIHDAIHSTNSYLHELAGKGGESGLVCFAEYQSAGKGRRGRTWVSPFGQNIYLSILWRYQDGPAAIAGLSLALGVAVIRALRQMGLKDVGLKWPNDIYWQQRKLAGILVEVSGESSGPCHAVIGLGVNFYLSAEQAENIGQPWTGLTSILGETAYARRNELAALLLNHLMPVIADFENQRLENYAGEWRSYDCMLGKNACLYVGDQAHEGTIAGIDDNGLLLLKDDEGGIRAFASGEVSFRGS
ncbi:MAG: bifunctional biotin--[acetyl-CoA-carboxylase] ligase/biotin operon repressor BirA [Methylomonas sp.]